MKLLLRVEADLARCRLRPRTLPRSIARLKIALGCPCAVNRPPGGAGREALTLTGLISHAEILSRSPQAVECADVFPF
jgi:hypothetical protein